MRSPMQAVGGCQAAGPRARPAGEVILRGMDRGNDRGAESASRIPGWIRQELPNIVASWREARRGDAEDGAYSRLTTNMEQLVSVFIDFLQSPDSVETFTRGGAVRALVGDIAENQH